MKSEGNKMVETLVGETAGGWGWVAIATRLATSNVKPTLFQDRLLSLSY
jgi:hypothetical protein